MSLALFDGITTHGATLRGEERMAREDEERSRWLAEQCRLEQETMRSGVTTCATCGDEFRFQHTKPPRLCRECRKAEDRELKRQQARDKR